MFPITHLFFQKPCMLHDIPLMTIMIFTSFPDAVSYGVEWGRDSFTSAGQMAEAVDTSNGDGD
jgi:hypothetical protein